MKFCPDCGKKLKKSIIDEMDVKDCPICGYIDWNNWINISCVVVAYNEHNEILMVRLKGKEEDKITFPGGYRNLGETLEEAARREFHEETGMVPNELKLFKTYTKDAQRLVWIVYKARIEQISFIDNAEVSELLFVSKSNPADKEQLRGTLTEQLLSDLFMEDQ